MNNKCSICNKDVNPAREVSFYDTGMCMDCYTKSDRKQYHQKDNKYDDMDDVFKDLFGDVFDQVLKELGAEGESIRKTFRQWRTYSSRINSNTRQTSASTPKSDRLQAVITLITRGSTEGEREAAKAAYKRITGKDYK